MFRFCDGRFLVFNNKIFDFEVWKLRNIFNKFINFVIDIVKENGFKDLIVLLENLIDKVILDILICLGVLYCFSIVIELEFLFLKVIIK